MDIVRRILMLVIIALIALISSQVLLSKNSLRKVVEISLENFVSRLQNKEVSNVEKLRFFQSG